MIRANLIGHSGNTERVKELADYINRELKVETKKRFIKEDIDRDILDRGIQDSLEYLRLVK